MHQSGLLRCHLPGLVIQKPLMGLRMSSDCKGFAIYMFMSRRDSGTVKCLANFTKYER